MSSRSTNSLELSRFIWKFIKKNPWIFLGIFLLSFIWPIDSTAWPYLMRFIVDTLTHYETDRVQGWLSLQYLLFAAVGLWVFLEVGFRSRDFMCAYIFPKLEADIRMKMFDHVQHHSPKYFNDHFAGSLANKINDMTTQIPIILKHLTLFISAIAATILSLIFLYHVNVIFTWILLIWIAIHASICLYFASKCVKYSNEHGEARSLLNGKIVDSFTNNFAVNLFFRFKKESLYLLPYQKIEKDKNALAQMSVVWMLTWLSLLFIFAMIILTFFLFSYWTQNKISSGELIQVFNTTFNVIFILWIAGDILPQFFQSVGIASQALTIMNDPKDVLDAPNNFPLVVSKGEIIFENVSFYYGNKPLFHQKNVHIKGSEKVGLVGYSGAGKSSFVNLILRFYNLQEGRILIDGQDIAQVSLESLRNQVSLIPQEAMLFHRTLAENIQYGNLNASDEDIKQAAKLAYCDDFILKCPQGYQSLVGERGTNLSGGERQRIAIARAILAASPILILDEATSALDSVTEKFIQDSLEQLMNNRTTLVIAHRLSTLSKMDRILVFDQGHIVEEGSHHELMQINGHYAKMWQMQAGGFLPSAPLN